MPTYSEHLTCWTNSLAAGRSDALLADIAQSCTADDVARYLENAMGERRRLLIEELSFVALAFDDFIQRVDRYLSETPRRAYDVTERDQEQFLAWLRRGELNAQQKDFVACQAAEYECYRLAQKNRVAHREFQRLLRERQENTETGDERERTIVVNPVHVWSRLEIAAECEQGAQAGDVVFVAVEHEIRTLWLSETEREATRDLTAHQRVRRIEWRARHPEQNNEGAADLCQKLMDGGLIVIG